MIKYSEDKKTAFVDGYRFTRDKDTGYYLSSRKINGKRKRLHIYVWESANGEIPKGYEIHHIDKNKNNNELNNLQLLTVEEHRAIHAVFDEERKEKARKILLEKAVPKSVEWHKSKEGRKWHSEHMKEVMSNMPMNTYVCCYCGKEYESKKKINESSNKFCSNKCKSAYRRKSGVDDIEKVCEKCGKTYIENKYTKTKLCPDCRNPKGRQRRCV